METSSRRLGELQVPTPPKLFVQAPFSCRGCRVTLVPLWPPHLPPVGQGEPWACQTHRCLHPASPLAFLPSSRSRLGHPALYLCFVCPAMLPVTGISLLLDCYSVILFG